MTSKTKKTKRRKGRAQLTSKISGGRQHRTRPRQKREDAGTHSCGGFGSSRLGHPPKTKKAKRQSSHSAQAYGRLLQRPVPI